VVNDERDELTTFERRAREVLEQSVADLDGRTRSKLTRARHAALAEVGGHAKRYRWQWLVPAGGLATVALVAIVIVANRNHVAGHEPSGALEDFEIVAQDENMDMLRDVDFYAWIDTEGQAAQDSGI
jgi:hypothetical protein